MRFLVKISFPVEEGNKAARNGFKALAEILKEQKPEAAYFFPENGKRTGLLVINLDDASQIPALAEPWFLAFNAAIEFYPAMTPKDLEKAGPAVKKAVKKHG